VDENRIAYVGHSFGATWGGVLVAVEKRIKTCILMGGLPSVTDFSLRGAPKFDRYMKILEEQVPKDMLEGFVAVISPLSPERFVRHAAPCSILFQFGLYDSWISKKAADIYFEAANGPKEARWYPTSHEFTDTAALLDRASWLEREIGLAPATPILGKVMRLE
jgi:cephalosporin-C deacetylase-like acetyl esterase